MKAKVNKVTIEIRLVEIYDLEVDAVVHSTDNQLSLSRVLIEAAGPTIQEECQKLGWCDVGTAVMTNAGHLKATKIIHAVGPRWGEGSERGKLANVTWNLLNIAEASQISTLAIPAISTGTLGYPVENCASTMLTQIIDFTFEKIKYLKTITICLDNEIALETFEQEFKQQIATLKETGDGKIRA